MGFDWSDVSPETFAAFRQVFSGREPDHPFNALNDGDFLRSIGGWKRDRERGSEGLTVAGLLMFGKFQAIQDEFPDFMLDYQERPEAKTENRWIDRLTLDGKWSGNLYDFYRRVYLKLTADLKVPFALTGAERRDETPVHIALREALANVLVHADYSDRASILVVKRPDMFGFRNPGLMRVPVDLALKGGESDCRNRTLHQMFRLVGVGEQAGSGVPKILQGWETQHWNPPNLHEKSEPYDQTLLELRMIDLFPDDAVNVLRNMFGEDFDRLEQSERVALAIAASEGTVNHSRLCTLSTDHPADNSRILHRLVQDGFLRASGTGRGVVYYLPGVDKPSPEDIFPTASSSPMLEAEGSNVRSGSGNVSSSSSVKQAAAEPDGTLKAAFQQRIYRYQLSTIWSYLQVTCASAWRNSLRSLALKVVLAN
ncbi:MULTISPECIES: ATP-binding protein [Pseudomonadota]|uniref:ATP-binding protein n=1 Tax=Pseudomonadota TaxID=1224 RepID=UPI003297514C